MKIWLINPYGPIPSESWRDYSFAMMGEALSSAGHDVVWWTSNFSHHFKRFRSKGWEDIRVQERFVVRLVPTSGYRKNVGVGRIVRDIYFAARTYSHGKILPPPDCIVTAESPLTLGYAGQKLGDYHKRPVIHDQMDLWPEFFERAFPALLRPLVKGILYPIYKRRKTVYRKLDGVIALAKPYLEVPLREAPELCSRPNQVIYNGIDVKAFREQMKDGEELNGMLPEKPPGEVWAVFAGSLGDSYDIPALLKVAEWLDHSELKLRIIIAGDGPFRQQVESAASHGTNSSVLYVGKLPPEKLAKLYSLCDIGLCTYSKRSNVEMPDKIYDYTAAGLPVINSLKGEVGDVILDKGIGLQYLAEDPDDLFAALKSLTTDQVLRRKMAKNSFEAGMEYDQNVQYGKFVDFVENLCVA